MSRSRSPSRCAAALLCFLHPSVRRGVAVARPWPSCPRARTAAGHWAVAIGCWLLRACTPSNPPSAMHSRTLLLLACIALLALLLPSLVSAKDTAHSDVAPRRSVRYDGHTVLRVDDVSLSRKQKHALKHITDQTEFKVALEYKQIGATGWGAVADEFVMRLHSKCHHCEVGTRSSERRRRPRSVVASLLWLDSSPSDPNLSVSANVFRPLSLPLSLRLTAGRRPT